ncbi:Di-copper centre-containing protein [Corynespora cassiicola Philippines]|uniref:Di-copper centre-containing protein n=1 Tax=Corynespora cassiicola Philippines TaxID=1448308 RepID=A0A2T2NA50_CORCC|nr:Di-copper centre-containing protein [Corynespora cassiicola Philippines]
MRQISNTYRHTLSDSEKDAYISAELCLMNSASQLGHDFTTNRWEDLMYSHVIQGNIIHGVSAFLPWHRWYVRVHEALLQSECGYEGAHPYWDELHDIDDLAGSIVFDPVTGFGSEGGECITDGPFANHTVRITERSLYSNECINRKFNKEAWTMNNQTNLDKCSSATSYGDVSRCMEGSAHGGGHTGVGGLMNDFLAAPNDPIFFLHHAYVDKLWWEWQQQDLSTRLTDMSGRNVPSAETREFFNFDEPGPEFTDYFGDGGNETTLQHNMWMVDITSNITISDIMDLHNDINCATYI